MRLPALFLFVVVALVAAITLPSGTEAKRTYGVSSVSVENCVVRNDLDNEIGDDRTGMAITPSRLFHLGDDYMASLNATTLEDDRLLAVTDGIFSDLADGALWTLAFDNSTFLDYDGAQSGNFSITHLIPLTPTNATIDTSRSVIALSQPINPIFDNDGGYQPVLFAGVRGFVIASGIDDSSPASGLFYVSLNTGLVSRLFPQNTTGLTTSGWLWPPVRDGMIERSENWAAWGVMEETKGEITLLATGQNLSTSSPGVPVRRGESVPVRLYRWSTNGTILGDALVATPLSDCAAFTVNYFEKSEASKRWFLHAEGEASPISDSSEWVASCPASHFSLCGNGKINAGEECDDGNLINGDGCNDACDNEPSNSSSSVLSCLTCQLITLAA